MEFGKQDQMLERVKFSFQCFGLVSENAGVLGYIFAQAQLKLLIHDRSFKAY